MELTDEVINQTIYINPSSSRCGNCGKNALPSEGSHISSPEFSELDRKGCGQVWLYSNTDYMGTTLNKIIPNKFPQYEWVGTP